ncbi:MAG: GNAT family N-acetyltransferase [Sphingomonadales bacterium]|nr:MAG: GNAT family N-acetyltransferase [Sphingomonadales bacterium]
MSKPAIRAGGTEDAAALALVGAATFLETYAGEIPGADILTHVARHHTVEAYHGLLARPDTRVWLAEVGGAAIGYAMLAAPDQELATADDADLKRIYVLSKWHGTGLARQLAERAMAAARVMGKRRMLIGVKPDNHRAIAFYRKIGAELVGGRRFTVGESVFDDPVFGVGL